MRPSLARRLLVSTVVGLAVLLLAGGGALSFAFRRSAEAAFDTHLDAWLRGLVAGLRADASGRPAVESAPADARFEQLFSGWYWQVMAEDGAVLAASRSLWDATLALPAGTPLDGGGGALPLAGPREQTLRGRALRVTLPRASAPLVVLVAGDAEELRSETRRFDALLAVALLALGTGILALTAFQMRLALRPLRELARELGAVRAGDRERVGEAAPRELGPLVDSLNALLAHDAELVASARTRTADLAHALRTPLSLVLAEAGELGDERGRRIARHADTMRRHIEFRLSSVAARPAVATGSTQVGPIVDALADTLARLHPHVAIERDVANGAAFAGAREDLEEIAGNLLENACKWARGRVRVTVSRDDEKKRVALAIDDDGPGLDASERSAVLARGVRLDETAPGSGLGLAIVADVVACYGGTLRLDSSALGGLRAETVLPASAAS
jgi:signal transduction histidine kinase